MAITYVDAVAEQLPAVNTTIYTCPLTASSAHIQFAIAANEDALATTIQVNIVKVDESVAVTNIYVPTTTVLQGRSSGLSGIINAVLLQGDYISVVAGDADRLNVKLSIKEISL